MIETTVGWIPLRDSFPVINAFTENLYLGQKGSENKCRWNYLKREQNLLLRKISLQQECLRIQSNTLGLWPMEILWIFEFAENPPLLLVLHSLATPFWTARRKTKWTICFRSQGRNTVLCDIIIMIDVFLYLIWLLIFKNIKNIFFSYLIYTKYFIFLCNFLL